MSIFQYRQPDYNQANDMEKLNVILDNLLDQIKFSCPNCRETDIAVVKLEECAMWAKKAICLRG